MSGPSSAPSSSTQPPSRWRTSPGVINWLSTFWLGLARLWAGSRASLLIVQPTTFSPRPSSPGPVSSATGAGTCGSGHWFREAFLAEGILYQVCKLSAFDLYEHMEPLLNAGRVAWVDEPKVEQEALGLLWRGSKITHPGNEHDDFINGVAGCVYVLEREHAIVTPHTIAQEEERRPESPLDAYLEGREEHAGTKTGRMKRWTVEQYTQQLGNARGAAMIEKLDHMIATAPADQVYRELREMCYRMLGLDRLLNNGMLTNIEAEDRLDDTLNNFEEE